MTPVAANALPGTVLAQTLIATLPPIVLQAEDLAHRGGMNVAGIARRLNLSQAEVDAHLSLALAARRILAEAMVDRGGDVVALGRSAVAAWKQRISIARRQTVSRPLVQDHPPRAKDPPPKSVRPHFEGRQPNARSTTVPNCGPVDAVPIAPKARRTHGRRPKVTVSDLCAAADLIMERGSKVTVQTLRKEVGNIGSMQTIVAGLSVWLEKHEDLRHHGVAYWAEKVRRLTADLRKAKGELTKEKARAARRISRRAAA